MVSITSLMPTGTPARGRLVLSAASMARAMLRTRSRSMWAQAWIESRSLMRSSRAVAMVSDFASPWRTWLAIAWADWLGQSVGTRWVLMGLFSASDAHGVRER